MPLGKPPANKLPTKKRVAVKRMFERGVSVAGIAEAHGVDRKTVYTWAKAGGWTRPADRAQATPAGGDGGDGGDQRAVVDGGPIIVDDILAETLHNLRAAMDASLKNFDYRPVPNLATSIVKTLEAWERRHPASPAALAMLAVEMGLKPRQFMEAVVEQWRLKGGGQDCEFED